jgi:crossover junction endodeoxyribonuclease RuvC
MGFGVVEQNGNQYTAIDFGCLRLSSRQSFTEKLKRIYDELLRVIETYHPDEFAIEDLFYAENAKVAIKMGHARGVALLAAVNSQIPTAEYSPKEIKLSIAGNGAASKQQIQRMVQQLLGLKVAPDPLDVSDALAVALCHIHRRRKIQ